MKKLIGEGKITHWGLSQVIEETIRRAHAVCPVTAIQNRYCMMYRDNETLWIVVVFYVLIMAGISMIIMPMTTAGLHVLPDNLISHGTAMINTFRQVGGSIGTALLVTIYTKVGNYAFDNCPE